VQNQMQIDVFSLNLNEIMVAEAQNEVALGKWCRCSLRRLMWLPIVVTLAATSNLDYGSSRPCLVPQKFYKIFQIPRHIESLDVCMEY